MVSWVGGFCGAAGGVAGFFIGYLYGRDQAIVMSNAPWYGLAGLVIGIIIGLLVSIGPVVVLAAFNERRWAQSTPVRALLAAVAAAVPIFGLAWASGATWQILLLCAVVGALPAGIATIGLDRRTTRELARRTQAVST